MKVIKFIFFLFLLGFSIYYLNNNIINNSLKIERVSSKKNNILIDNIFSFINNKDVNNINTLLSFKIKDVNKELLINDTYINNEPLIYFYNTHQTEEYQKTIYNISPTVLTVSNILKEELNNFDITSIVEERSISDELNKRDLVYSYSYRISREYLEDVRSKYPSIIYFFDIHRDSLSKELSTSNINNKSYAKIMFVIAKKNDNYLENEKNVKIMEEYLNKNYPGILRNTYYQPLYNYNQDVNSTTFLVEVGGESNTLEEIYNSSVALADAIKYLMENNI